MSRQCYATIRYFIWNIHLGIIGHVAVFQLISKAFGHSRSTLIVVEATQIWDVGIEIVDSHLRIFCVFPYHLAGSFVRRINIQKVITGRKSCYGHHQT